MKVSTFTATLVGLLISSSAFAGYSDIPQSQLAAYKKAVLIAGKDSVLLHCTQTGHLSKLVLSEYITEAQTGKVDRSGTQPILVFEKVGADQSKSVTTIVSSPDYKKVLSIKAEEFVVGDVNSGDMLNPEISKGYVLSGSGECQ